jgi:hypothetical protein
MPEEDRSAHCDYGDEPDEWRAYGDEDHDTDIQNIQE